MKTSFVGVRDYEGDNDAVIISPYALAFYTACIDLFQHNPQLLFDDYFEQDPDEVDEFFDTITHELLNTMLPTIQKYQDYLFFDMLTANVNTGNNFAYDNAIVAGRCYQNTPASTDKFNLGWDYYFLRSGTWNAHLYCTTQNNNAKIDLQHIEPDTTLHTMVSAWDLYAGATTTLKHLSQSFTVSADRTGSIHIKVNGKNASSSNYFVPFSALALVRTGD